MKLPPDPRVCSYDGARAQWYIDNAPGSIRARQWFHERCWDKLRDLSYDELETLAACRRATLAAMKREAEYTYGCHHGRRAVVAKR